MGIKLSILHEITYYFNNYYFIRSLFPCGEDMVAIIDDREDVWNYSNNVIPVLPYKFFSGIWDQFSFLANICSYLPLLFNE